MQPTKRVFSMALSLAIAVALLWLTGHTMTGQGVPLRVEEPTVTMTPSDTMTNTFYLPVLIIPYRINFPMFAQPPFLHEPYPPDASNGKSLNVYLAWKVLGGAFRNPTTFTVYLDANNPSPQTVITDSLTIRRTPAFLASSITTRSGSTAFESRNTVSTPRRAGAIVSLRS